MVFRSAEAATEPGRYVDADAAVQVEAEPAAVALGVDFGQAGAPGAHAQAEGVAFAASVAFA